MKAKGRYRGAAPPLWSKGLMSSYRTILPSFLFLILTAVVLPAGSDPAWTGGRANLEVIHRIKAEAFEEPQVMDHIFQLTDVNGPRVTNSPGHRQAVAWCIERLKEWGFSSVHTEDFEFGKGWSFSHFEAHLAEPAYAPLSGFPLAWSSGTNGEVTAEAIHAVLKTEEDLEKFKGKLKGKMVLMDEARKIELNVRPIGSRYTEGELEERTIAPEPQPKSSGQQAERKKRREFSDKLLKFLADEGAVAVIRTGYKGEAGLVAGTRGGSHKPDLPVPPPMFAIMPEHYNRIIRLLDKKIGVKVSLNVTTEFHEDDLNAQNVIAELRGTGKPDEVVMLGGHLDSWHGGTGAVDNAAGVAISMEALRILKKLDLKMDRTVRLGLWAGEEQGLLGSRAYVKQHFGDRETMELKPDHEKLAAYFNFDNGSGKIRGIYLQGNDMLAPVFEAWMKPLHSIGATTVSIRNTGSTDHVPFDEVGLPGFQFIQDPLEYSPRTHHSNADLYDHVVPADVMQSVAVMATFVYHAATRPEMLPRKPLPKPQPKEDETEKRPQPSPAS